jgi:dihydroneopterin aldolase
LSYEREVEVSIDGLAVVAYHGALPQEQLLGQTFYLNLRYIPLRDAACDTDDLADAVDYGAVASCAVEIASGGPYRLIEHLAHRVAEAILDRFRVDEVTVHVAKPSAPVPHVFENLGATVTLRRRG